MWQQFFINAFELIAGQVEGVTSNLTPEEINRQPAKDANTIAWLTWHLTRSHDRNMSEVAGKDQLWITEKWYEKFGRAADPGETGVGHNPDQVAAFRAPDAETIIAYHRAVVARINEYIETRLTEEELERLVTSPTLGTTYPVMRRMLGVISEGFQHIGQAAYVRGLIKGQGWLGR